MKVLVTGANGFVGSHTVQKLVSGGYSVRCLIRKTSDLKWLAGLPVEYAYGDVNDVDSLKKALIEIDAIVHNAGILRAHKSAQYYKVNSAGTENILACSLERVKKFVYISSLAAHGPSFWDRPRKFSDAPAPVSDYGKSKLAGENVVKNNSKIPWTIIVPSAVYGPRDKDMFSFFKMVSSGIAIETRRARFINLTYVEDIAAVVALSLRPDEFAGDTFYVAHEKQLRWLDICEQLAKIMDKKVFRITVPEFAFRAAAYISEKTAGIFGKPAVFNKQKAVEFLQPGWVLEDGLANKKLAISFTDFYSGAQKTYNWYKENRWLR